MSSGLAERQWNLVDWKSLRTGGGTPDVGADLRTLLTDISQASNAAFDRMENAIVSQGHLFECAPSVVRVITAAIADESIPERNLGATLDLLCRILAGFPDVSEMELGRDDLDQRCHQEAMRGYWPLMKIAAADPDEFDTQGLAREAVEMLDERHSIEFLS